MLEVDVPSLATYLNRTPVFDWYDMVWCGALKMNANMPCVKKQIKTTCLKYANHSKLNN